jgi:hypothetical protein
LAFLISPPGVRLPGVPMPTLHAPPPADRACATSAAMACSVAS